MPTVQDQGICVRHWDWSETSQTVTLLTRDHGLLRCIAKGSKREKAPFSGGVELLTRADLVAIIKPSSELAQLTAWDLTEPMAMVRRSYARYIACMYVVDLIPRTVHDLDPHPALYDALARTLSAVGGQDACPDALLPAWLAWFQWTVLDETGSKPEVLVDVRTGEDLAADAPVGFAWDLGGLTALPRSVPESSGVARIRPGTASILRSLDQGVEPPDLAGSVDEITRAGRVLAARLRSLIGHEPPALGWVFPEISRADPR